LKQLTFQPCKTINPFSPQNSSNSPHSAAKNPSFPEPTGFRPVPSWRPDCFWTWRPKVRVSRRPISPPAHRRRRLAPKTANSNCRKIGPGPIVSVIFWPWMMCSGLWFPVVQVFSCHLCSPGLRIEKLCNYALWLQKWRDFSVYCNPYYSNHTVIRFFNRNVIFGEINALMVSQPTDFKNNVKYRLTVVLPTVTLQ